MRITWSHWGSPCMCCASGAEGAWRGSAPEAGGSMERNVARLFRERVALFGEVHFTQASMLAGALPMLYCMPASKAGACCTNTRISAFRPR